MFCCNKCDKSFKTNWQLQRHYSKKRPCQQVPQNSYQNPQNEYFVPQNEYFVPQNEYQIPQNEYLNCKFCNKEFSRNDNLKRHEDQCKDKDDHVRNMELQLNIKFPHNIPKNTCRFCSHISKSLCNLPKHIRNCKAKEEYKRKLEEQIKFQGKGNTNISNTVNNNTNNTNNTLNYNDNSTNFHINCLGNENIDYITTKILKQLWKEVKSDEEGFVKTIKIIHGNKDHPENHNIIYTNLKSNSALVKHKDTFEYKNINDVLKDVSSNTLDLIVFHGEFDDLNRKIKEKYESVCDDDEMNRKASSLAKIELYNCYKQGIINKPN